MASVRQRKHVTPGGEFFVFWVREFTGIGPPKFCSISGGTVGSTVNPFQCVGELHARCNKEYSDFTIVDVREFHMSKLKKLLADFVQFLRVGGGKLMLGVEKTLRTRKTLSWSAYGARRKCVEETDIVREILKNCTSKSKVPLVSIFRAFVI